MRSRTLQPSSQQDLHLTTQAKMALKRWKDPILFSQDVLKQQVWSKQAEILTACTQFPRVAVRSGHKVGKSRLASVLALWFWAMHPGARVVLTAPSFRQVKSILWREITQLYEGARWPLGGEISKDPDTGLKTKDGREIVGFSTSSPERMAGISGANVLFIIDEASGVPESIFEAIEGNRAGGARMAMFSNPTRTSGTFYDAFHKNHEFWKTFHVSSTDSPNVTGKEPSIPGLAVPEYIEEKRREWGEDSSLYAVRVLGNFSSQGDNSIVSLELLNSSLSRWADIPEQGDLVLGVDVARFGDDETVIQPVRGLKALKPVVVQGLDVVNVVGKVIETARSLRGVHELVTVNVDVIGIGSGVADILRRTPWLRINDVNVSIPARNHQEYVNLRTELWFMMRAWLKDGGIPEDNKLEGDLVAPTYEFDVRGRYKVESKDEIKKRLNRSTDRADALCLAILKGKIYEDVFLSIDSRW